MLKISPELSLPIDFMTKTTAIVAQRRKGKTYTAKVIAEELVAAGQPWVALDPLSAWWGMLSSANGLKPGLPVKIIGGQHGHIPIERTDGALVAELVINHPGWYIVDISLLGSHAAEREFAADFAERLYRLKGQPGNDFPLHLFVDEADLFVPQDREKGDLPVLGAFQSIVRRGGLRGLGTTLISQRPALINKSVLVQLDMLIVLRLVAGNDQDYLKDNYFKRAGTKQEIDALMESMASLKLGEAWVWEPGAEPSLFVRTQIREGRTFNSSATPKVGEVRIEPKAFAKVNLGEISSAMATTIERAKEQDPTELQRRLRDANKRIAELERRPPTSAPAKTEVQEVEVEVVPPAVLTARDLVRESATMVAELEETARRAHKQINQALGQVDAALKKQGKRTVAARSKPARPEPESPAPKAVPRQPQVSASPTGALGKGERKVMTAIVEFPGSSNEFLSVLAGYNPKKSTLAVMLGKLRREGFVEPATGEGAFATQAGVNELGGDYEALDTPDDVFRKLRSKLSPSEQRVVDAMAAAGRALSHEELCEATGYDPEKSTMAVMLGKLRRMHIVDKKERRLIDAFADVAA